MQLRVIEPFGGYKQGELISDAKAVAAVLASTQAQYVVQVADTEAASTADEKESLGVK
jgi:hypothetical protein